MERNKTEKEESKNIRERRKGFPLTTLKKAEEALRAVNLAGGRISVKAISEELGIRGGGLGRVIASAKRWGLITGSGTLTVTELGKRILHPISEKELLEARMDSFMKVKLFGILYQRFGKNLPNDSTFKAILIREYEIKEKDAKTILNIYKDSVRNFLSAIEKGRDPPLESNLSKNNLKEKQKDFLGVSIIIEAPSGKFNLYAKNKEEFNEIVDEKLKKVWDVIDTLWVETSEEKEKKLEINHANRNSEDVLDNIEEE